MRKRLSGFWTNAPLVVAVTAVTAASSSLAQSTLNSLSNVVTVTPPEKVVAKRGTTETADFAISVKTGFHVNSNKPADEYLIPLKFTFPTDGPVQVDGVEYPKPSMEKLAFSPTPVSVFQGEFHTHVKFKAAANAPAGTTQITGKLRYQACNERMCLPPRTLEIKVPVEIRN